MPTILDNYIPRLKSFFFREPTNSVYNDFLQIQDFFFTHKPIDENVLNLLLRKYFELISANSRLLPGNQSIKMFWMS